MKKSLNNICKYLFIIVLFLLFSSNLYMNTTKCSLLNSYDTYKCINRKVKAANSKTVYLTFDDGPSKNTELILDILKENNVHATFFIISPYIEPHIKFIKRAYEEGNSIGNHTADHEFKYIYTSEKDFLENFNKQQEFIKNVTGSDCTIFRFPGGSHNTLVRNAHGENFTKNLTLKLNDLGVTVYDWNVDSGDAKGNNIPVSTLVNNVSKNIKDKDGNYKNPAIILMHDCMTKTTTVEALPSIINLLKEAGYEFGVLE